MQKLCSKDPSGKGIHCFCVDIDAQRELKNAVNATFGISKAIIGPVMRIFDNRVQKNIKIRYDLKIVIRPYFKN